MSDPKFTTRARELEWLDHPNANRSARRNALRGYERINRWTASDRVLWDPLLYLLRNRPKQQPTRLLDVACGAGDLPIRLWMRAKQMQLNLKVIGTDSSRLALRHARRRALLNRAKVSFQQLDAVHDELPAVDVITCSLYLHRLGERKALDLLRRMANSARLGLIACDPIRSRSSYIWAQLQARLLGRSRILISDHPHAVESAFTPLELLGLGHAAGLRNARILTRAPFRQVLYWERDRPQFMTKK